MFSNINAGSRRGQCAAGYSRASVAHRNVRRTYELRETGFAQRVRETIANPRPV
jgi:hypothetical protein